MRRIWRLCLVATLAATSFAVAVGRFSDAAEKGCAQRVREDLAYQVTLLDQPRMSMSSGLYRLAVSREGRPVSGADVCVNLYMEGMSAMATADTGREVSAGTYEVSLTFLMGGRWRGRVLITEPGTAVVAVPLDLEVAVDAADPAAGVGATTTVPPTTVPETTVPEATTVPETTTTAPQEAGQVPAGGRPGTDRPAAGGGTTAPPPDEESVDPPVPRSRSSP